MNDLSYVDALLKIKQWGVILSDSIAVFEYQNNSDSNVMIGAFSGAVVFVFSAVEFSVWKRFFLFQVSFLVGVMASDFTAEVISNVLPQHLFVGKPIGAMVASASAVRVLMLFTARTKEQKSFIEQLKKIKWK